jgi:UDP-glucose 4-epimerase
MARFLVTGGAGFMGSHLVDALLEQGHPVRVFDDLSTGSREKISKPVEFIQGDVTDPRLVEQAFEGIDACFHLAAIASVVRSNCEWLRTHQVNLTGTINVFDQARRLRQRRELPVVYASTAAVYSDCPVTPIDEYKPVAPLSAYAGDNSPVSFMRVSPVLFTGFPRSDYAFSIFTVRGRIFGRLFGGHYTLRG